MAQQGSDRAIERPPGRRLFALANVLTLLFALGHAGGVVQTMLMVRQSAAKPANAGTGELRELFARLDAYQTPKLLGFQASLLDLRSFFNIAFSVLLISMFTTNVVALSCASSRRDAVARLSIIHAVSMLALAGLSFRFNIAQGIVTATLIALLFISAALRAGRSQPNMKTSAH